MCSAMFIIQYDFVHGRIHTHILSPFFFPCQDRNAYVHLAAALAVYEYIACSYASPVDRGVVAQLRRFR